MSKNSTKKIQIITFEESQQTPLFRGECKITINAKSNVKALIVQNEESLLLEQASLDQSFIRNKFILYSLSSVNLMKFVLVFDDEETCKKVHDVILKQKKLNGSKNDFDFHEQQSRIENELVLPLCHQYKNNKCEKLKGLLKRLAELLEKKKKDKYIKLIENQNCDLIENSRKRKVMEKNPPQTTAKKFKMVTPENVNKNFENNHQPLEDSSSENEYETTKTSTDGGDESYKKNSSENDSLTSDDEDDIKDKANEIFDENEEEINFVVPYNIITPCNAHKIKSPNFKFLKSLQEGKLMHLLLIFDSKNKKLCYEFYWLHHRKRFICRGCKENKKSTTAMVRKDSKGNKFIEIRNEKHYCKMKEYIPENYDKKIIKSSNFELATYLGGSGIRKKTLIIFDAENRNFCYEYAWNKRYDCYICRGCNIAKQRILKAKIIEIDDGENYVELDHGEHVCELREYKPEKRYDNNQIVKKPGFELRTMFRSGKDHPELIIFNPENKELCHIYRPSKSKSHFNCSGCKKKGQLNVDARKVKNEKDNDDDDEYFILGNTEHICEWETYKPAEKTITTGFEIRDVDGLAKPHIFMFVNESKEFCYEFAPRYGLFQCMSCANISLRNGGLIVTVKLGKNENGENFLKITDRKHICEPRKFQPNKNEEKILKSPNFQFYSAKGASYSRLIIFDSNDRKLCYKYHYNPQAKSYRCQTCYKATQKSISAKVWIDENGGEYLRLSKSEHTCKMLEYNDVKKEIVKVLKKSGIEAAAKANVKEEVEIDEEKFEIIRKPNFELRQNKRSKQKLTIFHRENRDLCYEYFCETYFQTYFCHQCYKLKHRITAKVCEDENGEKFIKHEKKEHICDAIPYINQKEYTKNYDFIIFNKGTHFNTPKLVEFLTPAKDLCYEYTGHGENLFRCNGCGCSRKQTSLKILNDENGKEYVSTEKGNHICEPRKYCEENYNRRIIYPPYFELNYNTRGIPNARMNIFDEENPNMGYEYFLKKDIYNCLGCVPAHVTAKLEKDEETVQKYLKLGVRKHHCEIRNLKEMNKIIEAQNYKIIKNENKI